jgi:signal transduction protein with GAF and PtsI domain
MPPLGNADLALVRETASRAVGPTKPARLLAGVVRGAARLCGARLASIALLTERRDALDLKSVFGTGGVIVEKRLPVRQSLNGTVISSARSFRTSDAWADRRPFVREIALRNKTRGVLVVPIATREAVLGTLAVARRVPWDFSSRDEALLEEFAGRVASPIEYACLGRRPWELGSGRRAADLRRLGPRERDIVALLLADRTCEEVAAALALSDHAVQYHVERLKLRFGKATLHGLLGLLVERQLLD